ncbi:MAG TPA: hypothetical protein VIC62_22310, partial [Nakamurella sp.]
MTLERALAAVARPAFPARPAVGGGIRRLVSFRDDVVVDRQGKELVVAHRWGTHIEPDVSSGLAAALERLTFGPTLPANVVDLVMTGAADPHGEVARLNELLGTLGFLLVHAVELDSAIVADVVPMSAGARTAGTRAELAGPDHRSDGDVLRLSRFAYLHQVDGVMVLESPLSLYRARFTDPRLVGLVGAAATARPVRELLHTIPNAEHLACLVLDLLVDTGLLELVTPTGAAGSAPVDPAKQARRARLRQWGFHDLLFHTRSRSGRHDEDFGATFRFLDEIEHERPVRELPAGPRLLLPVPDLDRVLATDPQLTVAMETRKSIRSPGKRPIAVEQLGEL